MKLPLAYRQRGTAGVPKAVQEEVASLLADYRKRMSRVTSGGYDAPESAINLPFDKSTRDAVYAARDMLGDTTMLRFVVLIGIGGSSQGAVAVYDAYRALHADTALPELIVADSANSRHLARLQKRLEHAVSPEEFALLIISKSGATAETIVNAECLLDVAVEKFGEEAVAKRTIVATDIDSPLQVAAEERGWGKVAIPKQVGGRFSVFSAAGLLPLALCGIDIESFCEGGTLMRDACLDAAAPKDMAVASAALIHHGHQSGKRINDHFFFTPELHALGMWYRQLFAESLGKQRTHDVSAGSHEHIGMLPTVSVGSSDLHSIAQLYFGGPHDRVTTFVWSGDTPDGPRVGSEGERHFPDIVAAAAGKSVGDLGEAILDATRTAYKDAGLPFADAVLTDLTPRSIGAFMMWKMLEVMYLGALWHINAFDQPEVERYKKYTERLLAGEEVE